MDKCTERSRGCGNISGIVAHNRRMQTARPRNATQGANKHAGKAVCAKRPDSQGSDHGLEFGGIIP